MKIRNAFRFISCTAGIRNAANTVDGINLAKRLRLVAFPISYKVLYIPGGAGFFFINSIEDILQICVIFEFIKYIHIYYNLNSGT